MGQRLFLGIPVSASARLALAEALRAHPVAARVAAGVTPENWHVTLVFLGETAPEKRARVATAVADAALGPAFAVDVAGLGVFPAAAAARTLWLGIAAGHAALLALQERVAAAALAGGHPLEARPFTPHLTLARVKPARDLAGLLALPAPKPVTVKVDRVALFLSHRGAAGLAYEELASVALAEPFLPPPAD